MSEVNATFKAHVGAAAYAGNQDVTPRAGKGGDILVSDLNAPYYQATKDGSVYHATTVGAGVAHNVDVEGTTWDVALYNPSGSEVDLVIIEARCARGTTGDIGPGAVVWVRPASATSTVPTGTAMAVSSGRIGANAANKAQAIYTVTVEGTDGVRMRYAFELNENVLATAGTPATSAVYDRVDGQIIVPPGYYVGLTGEGDAGAAPLLHLSLSWKEVPV